MILSWIKAHRLMLIMMIVIGIGAMFFVTHNQTLYRTPIAKVIAVKNGHPQKQTDQFENVDSETNQTLTVRMLNGRYRGQTLTVKNQFSQSGAMDQRYRVGDQIFLTQISKQHGQLSAYIKGYKRDVVLVFLTWLVIALLLLMMTTSGFFALLSVALNVVLFIIAIKLNELTKGDNALLIFSVLAVLFCFLSLLLVLGPNKKMLATFFATVIATSVSMLISLLVMAMTHDRGIYFESMEYVTQVPRSIFIAETLLGSLGAVMDESSDIIATLFELKEIDPEVTAGQLFISGRNIGKTIMGPLINVLFLIFMTDTFTSALLYIKNGNNWGYTFAMNMSLGTVQSLVSGIGIVLAIPLVSAFAALLLGKRGKKCQQLQP